MYQYLPGTAGLGWVDLTGKEDVDLVLLMLVVYLVPTYTLPTCVPVSTRHRCNLVWIRKIFCGWAYSYVSAYDMHHKLFQSQVVSVHTAHTAQ